MKARKQKSPIEDLVKALKKDNEYYKVWKSNISCAFMDQFTQDHRMEGTYIIANRAAANFLSMLMKEKQ